MSDDDQDLGSRSPPVGENEAPPVTPAEEVDRRDPAQVATAWGRGYFTHPRGESPPQAAQRLAALASPAVTAALADTQLPHYGQTTVRVTAGAPTAGTSPGAWIIRCTAITTNPDGAPAPNSPQPVSMRLQLDHDPAGWKVSEACPNDTPLP